MDVREIRANLQIENHKMVSQIKINTKITDAKDLMILGKGFLVLSLMVKYQKKLGCDNYSQYWTMFNKSLSLESGLPESAINYQLNKLCKSGFIIRTSRGMYRLNGELVILTK